MPASFLKYLNEIKTFRWLLFIGSPFIGFSAAGQNNITAIAAAFNQYHQNSIKEKLFVHTDKSFYVAGEIAWFKLYNVDASNHKPLKLSKVAYVEIVDSAHNHLLRAKIALNGSEGNGSFYLPLTLNSGNYKLRAYTNWMKNFGAAYFFEKNITIVNVQKRMTITDTKATGKIDLQFFPEGGNLVNNLPCKIAFKGTDQYGKGLVFTGILMDKSDTVLIFKPQHAGMGSFNFTPLSNHKYKAFIQTSSDESQIKELPVVYPAGYVMSVTDSADKIRVMVQSDPLDQTEVYLFAHTREIMKTAVSRYLQNGKAVFLVDKALLGDGISQITIFNNQKKPVCERLYFKRPLKQLEIKVNANQPLYAVRKKVSINIQPGNTEIKNDSASLSLSVYRLDSLQSPDNFAINNYLLLTADLKGSVEDPDYYFSKDDETTNADLDNLMLINGWRRFRWEDVLQNPKPFFNYVPEYNGQIITGDVINTITGKPASGIESFLNVPGFPAAFTSSVSDEEGRVKFELKDLYATSSILLQPNTFRDSIDRIQMTDPFSDDYSGTSFPWFTVEQNSAKTLLEKSISMQVQNIYSEKNLKHFRMPAIDSMPFYKKPDATYLLDNYTRFTTLEEVLREYVALVDVRKTEGRFHLNVLDLANGQMFKSDPLVLLDGVPVFDLNKLMRIDPLKLNTLEVVNRKYFLGSSVFNGVLNWTSYKGDMADYEPGMQATIIDYDGLQMEREFYSPVYAYDEEFSSHLPDFRNVLLWSPDIKIPCGSSKEITFYTSDLPGKYAVQVQGITKYGLFGNTVFTFEVKKSER